MEVKEEDVTSQSNKPHWVPTLHYSSRSWGYLREENWKWKKKRERAFRENTKYSKGREIWLLFLWFLPQQRQFISYFIQLHNMLTYLYLSHLPLNFNFLCLESQNTHASKRSREKKIKRQRTELGSDEAQPLHAA